MGHVRSRILNTHTYIVGIDIGGTANKFTVIDGHGEYLIDHLVELPSRVTEGPKVAISAMRQAFDSALQLAGVNPHNVRGVGLDTPGPASANGVLSSRGATNFSDPEWHGFDVRAALEDELGLPVVYNNDGNAAALYAHHCHFGPVAGERSSVAAIVGTGLGGGVIESGRIIKGAAGMAGELGHVHIPMHGLLLEGQPLPRCNCGFSGDAESVASLSGIRNNLLPFWLTQYPDHPLGRLDPLEAAKQVRTYGEHGDEMARRLFDQQAMALGRLFTIAANFTDPDAYFIGGGVIEAAPEFRDWFRDRVVEHTQLRDEQQRMAKFELVADLDMAGARGAAIAALSVIVHDV
ncbi:MAG TPA: ROK family protein [Ilumatobacter sp.]|nr:ROK family protein [Ilumatobacter sp.]